MPNKRLPYTLLVLSFAVTPCHAEMYKWIDENGNTVYSQSRPLSGNAKRVDPGPSPTVTRDEAQQKMNERLKRLDELRQERRQGKEKYAEEKKKKMEAEQNCNHVRSNISKLKNTSPNIQYKMPDGTYKRFTPEERQKLLGENTAYLNKHCQKF